MEPSLTEPSACSRCGATLPEAGAACPACGTRESAQLKPTAAMAALNVVVPPTASIHDSESAVLRRVAAHPSQTDDTLFNLSGVARAAVEAARKIEEERTAAEVAEQA